MDVCIVVIYYCFYYYFYHHHHHLHLVVVVDCALLCQKMMDVNLSKSHGPKEANNSL